MNIGGAVSVDIKRVKAREDKVVAQSVDGLTSWLTSTPNLSLVCGAARFTGPHTLDVAGQVLEALKIFINVGGRATLPDWPGIHDVPVSTNTSITVPKSLAAASFASESFDLTGIARDAVLNVEPAGWAVFAESCDLMLAERSNGKLMPAVKLKSGEFLARSGDAKAVLAARPAADFINRVPRAFLDTLPTRSALFAALNVPPKRLAPITYADVQAWVDAEAGLRPLFVTRWKALAQNPEFRNGLVAGLRAHPEWDRLLFPEKYLPKPAASAAPPSYR